QLARQAVEVLKSATERSQAESIEEFLLERNRAEVNLDSSSYGTFIVNSLLGIISEKAGEMELDRVKHFTISKANEVVSASLPAIAQIAQYGSELIADGDR
ncbi:hypothetical protein M1N05_01260, partial [Dehalococcoidales bacterium]|nr:hypothetical protein [Dehalococcoidales bacterium]